MKVQAGLEINQPPVNTLINTRLTNDTHELMTQGPMGDIDSLAFCCYEAGIVARICVCGEFYTHTHTVHTDTHTLDSTNTHANIPF